MTNYEKLYKAASIMLITGAVLLLLILGQVFLWALDRSPPFSVVNYQVTPVQAGQMAVVNVSVKRDLSRMCSVTYSRMFLDSKGVTWDLTEGVRVMTAQALNELDRRNPSALTIKISIPAAAAIGPGTIMTVLEYICNPVHQAYPIPVVMLTNVEVLK